MSSNKPDLRERTLVNQIRGHEQIVTVGGKGVRDFPHMCDPSEGHWSALLRLGTQDSSHSSNWNILNTGSGAGYMATSSLKRLQQLNP